MTKTLTSPLVGAHFRPPAKQIIAALPAGAKLVLQPEPENPYDPGAIKVLVDLAQVPEGQWPRLEAELPASGCDWNELRASGDLFLGYIAGAKNKVLVSKPWVGNDRVAEATFSNRHWRAKLGFAGDGQPLVVIEFEEVEGEFGGGEGL